MEFEFLNWQNFQRLEVNNNVNKCKQIMSKLEKDNKISTLFIPEGKLSMQTLRVNLTWLY